MKEKYVVERKVEGVETLLVSNGEEVETEEDTDVYTSEAAKISDERFVLKGYASGRKFFATDVLVCGEDVFRDKPWKTRYKALNNRFDWNNFVRLNRPFVVTSEEEMREASEVFLMLEDTEGVIIRGYEDVYDDEPFFVPRGELDG